MPAPILGAIGKYFSDNLSIQVWPEEIPRYDVSGNAINPQAGSVSPQVWPATQLVIEGKLLRTNTFEDAYSETGTVKVLVWGTTRAQVDDAMRTIEVAMVAASNWAYQGSPIGLNFAAIGFPNNWLYDLEVGQWTSQQRENERLASSLLCWLAEMDLTVGLHGALSTR